MKSLDDQIVSLQLATGKSYNVVSDMMNDYLNLGSELGPIGETVSEGATEWLRQGKSIQEVNDLVKSSVIFSKVGDMSAENATKYLTASLNGYKLQTDAAQSVVDKISNLDLNAAVSSQSLAESMSRVAVIANQSEISMDRLLAYLATMSEVTQADASKTGNAMKGILTRMNNIKAGKLELVDDDGTTEKLSDVETTLANVGINLRKTMTEYLSKDLDEWINKISSNMEEMTNAINGAISNAGLSTANTINAISSILRHYGISDNEISQSGLTDVSGISGSITGYASGTNYVPKDGIYRVNEEGMESIFSKQYGTLTFLNQGDKVFDADFTKSLLDNAGIATKKNMPDYAGMAKAIEKNIQNIQNLIGNTYVNNFYIDGAQDTDSIMKEIDKHLDKKIQAHDKKQVRDFRSLR